MVKIVHTIMYVPEYSKVSMMIALHLGKVMGLLNYLTAISVFHAPPPLPLPKAPPLATTLQILDNLTYLEYIKVSKMIAFHLDKVMCFLDQLPTICLPCSSPPLPHPKPKPPPLATTL